MAAKNRYQMRDRGRKGRPFWYVEDDAPDAPRKILLTSRSRSEASGYLSLIRRLDRERSARVAAGYHLPGL